MSESIPTYAADVSEMQDTGRKSAADAPELTGSEKQRADMASQIRQHNAGIFSPPEQDSAEQEPIDFDHINATIAENLELRERTAAQEATIADTREGLLDLAAYESPAESAADFAATAEVLLKSGGGERLESFVQDFADRYPQQADSWLASAESRMTQAAGAAGTQAAHTAQQEIEAQYVAELHAFQRERPDAQAGEFGHDLVAAALANDPDAFSSPQAFRAGLERAYAQAASAARGLERTAGIALFRQQFKTEANRHDAMRAPTNERAAAMARPTFPDADQLTGAILEKAPPTRAQRQSRLEQRDAAFRAQFDVLADRNNRGVFERGGKQ